MSVFKKDKAWFVRYRDENGSQRQKKAGKTKEEAIKLEKQLLKQRQNIKDGLKETNNFINTRPSIKFNELCKLYNEYIIRIGKNNQNTLHLTKKIARFLGKEQLINIKEKTIMNYQARRINDGIANSTLNTECAVLRSMLNYAKRMEFISTIPKIERLKTPPGRCRYLSKEEATALIKATDDDYEMQCLIKLALYTGMRKSELTSLKWKNINLNNGFIGIEKSKNGNRRDVVLSDEALSMLLEMKTKAKLIDNSKDDDTLFKNSASSSFHYHFKKILKNANITDFRFHDLRHTCASWLAIKGVPLYTIKEILGHSNIEMTMRYAHLSAASKKDAVSNIKLTF